jgi:hypothetical protein
MTNLDSHVFRADQRDRSRHRYDAAITTLIDTRMLEQVHQGGRGGPEPLHPDPFRESAWSTFSESTWPDT